MAEEDLIYGKNRHMFGGIEPSNMIEFSGKINDDERIEITAKIPFDTVIDGQTVCSVDGVLIRRTTNNYPKDEFDGVLIADIKENVVFVDETATNQGTWYYQAFPYSKQGVYNRNHKNRFVANAPDKLDFLSAEYIYTPGNGELKVVLDIRFNAYLAGATVRRNTIGFPLTENDGDLVGTIYSSGFVEDANVTAGIKYFYSVFPFTSNGDYNRDAFNRVFITPRNAKYYFGFDLDLNDSNPDTRVTYPDDVDNYNFTPVTDSNNTGDWNVTPGKYFWPRPCMIKFDGSFDYYLNPDDMTKKENGDSSDINDIAYEGNAMIQWPRIYTKRWEENGIYHFRCSDTKESDEWDCWCNYDKNNHVIDYFYISIFPAFLDSANKARSMYNNGTWAKNSLARDNVRGTGDSWNIFMFSDLLLLQDLYILVLKSTNANQKFVSSYASYNRKTASKFYLFNNEFGFFGMQYFNVHSESGGSYLEGCSTPINGNIKYKITINSHDGSSATDFNDSMDGYLTGNAALSNSTSGSRTFFFRLSECTKFGRLYGNEEASNTTYDCLQYYYYRYGFGHYVGGLSGLNGFFAFANSFSDYNDEQYMQTFICCKPTYGV